MKSAGTSSEPANLALGSPVSFTATPSPAPPAIPDHELLKSIGHGSYGEVWLARNVLGQFRAVKIVHRATFEDERPFEREFEGIRRFEPISRSHPSQLNILHVGRSERCFYYVMELADAAEPRVESESELIVERRGAADSLSHRMGEGRGEGASSQPSTQDPLNYVPRTLKLDLKRRGRLPPSECVEIGLALTTALAHLHAHGLVHRDIKPSNIIFVGGVPKLADIGLVTDVDASRSFVGTEGFLPPEGPGTPQADLYSLGKVLYEMSTGRDRKDYPALPLNWDALDAAEQARLLELNEVLVKVCEADPRRRYQTAEQLSTDLELLQRGQSVRRLRAAARRWTVARNWIIGVVLSVALIVILPLNKFFNRGRAPNPEAVRLFELGRWHHNQYTQDSQTKAFQYLNQAVQLEPNYADAYRLLFELNMWRPDSSEKRKVNRELAVKLMALDPKLAESHAALSWARHCEGSWRDAEQEIRTAIKLNPNYSTARCIYGYYLSLLGRVEEAVPQLQRAKELDPTSRLQATVAGFPFMTARQYDLAIKEFRKALELDPNFALAHWWIAKALEAKGEHLEALREYEKNAILSGVDEAKAHQRFDRIRLAYASAGPRGYWLKVFEDMLKAEASHEKPKVSEESRWPLDGVYAQLGENDKALDLIEKLLNDGEYGYWLRLDPLYEPLRNEPRFRAVLKKLELEK